MEFKNKQYSTLFYTMLLSWLTLIIASPALVYAGAVVVPDGFATTEGAYAQIPPLNNVNETFQLVMVESLLTGLTVGDKITGMTYRMNAGAGSWPAAAATFTDYTIRFGQAVNPPTALDTTFANNRGADTIVVRSGSLAFAANSFEDNGAPGPNPFGPEITFDTPYIYQGGDLLIEATHTGGSVTGRVVDLDNTLGSNAAWLVASSYNASSGTVRSGEAVIIQLTVADPAVGGTAEYIEVGSPQPTWLTMVQAHFVRYGLIYLGLVFVAGGLALGLVWYKGTVR